MSSGHEHEIYTIICYCTKLPARLIMTTVNNITGRVMASKNQDEGKVLLTLPNIKYLVEGLDTLLTTDLDGDKRAKVIQLRNDLLSHINSIFNDYS
jgi:hypothetical protein